jgi:hypothetical protein
MPGIEQARETASSRLRINGRTSRGEIRFLERVMKDLLMKRRKFNG